MEACQIAGCGRPAPYVRTAFRYERDEAGEYLPDTLEETGRICLCPEHDQQFEAGGRLPRVTRRAA